MLKHLRGSITFSLYFIYTIFLGIFIFPIGLLKLITPFRAGRDFLRGLHYWLVVFWADLNRWVIALMLPTKFETEGLEGLSTKQWYFVMANHISAIDIVAMVKVFNRKIPALRFFMKSQLICLPVIGWACWLMDFPFLKRYTKKQLSKNPKLEGRDFETLQKLIRKFRRRPLSITSFVEGTRYTKEKADKQQSPYRHLLKPRAGGLALILSSTGDKLHHILNVTIAYPDGKLSFWKFLCGQIKRIVIKVEKLPITQDLIGDYKHDEKFRQYIQNWINHVWQEKDELLEHTV